MAQSSKPNEIRITRVYDFPVAAVWNAWTDPNEVAKWWGPRGFTLTTHSKDLRVGGHWRYTMHGPDGTDYPNHTVYHEIEPERKLVYDHGGYDDRPPLFRVTALFIPTGDNQTTLDMTMTLPTPEEAEQMRGFIKQAGGNATWDRLDEYLGAESGTERFVLHRSFAAPIDMVFNMWTDPEHFARWLPPAGFTMDIVRADIRPGGSLFAHLTNGDMAMHVRMDYREVSPTRIEYEQRFCNADESPGHHPLLPVWPAVMLNTIDFTSEGPDETRVKVASQPIGEVTRDELEAFLAERGGMTQGWTGSFDQLEGELAARATVAPLPLP